MTASAWTQDRIDRLKALWLEGRTADQIARELACGLSRSAVLGKVYRMGLSHGRPAKPPKAPQPARPRRRPDPGALIPKRAQEPSGEGVPEAGVTSLLSVRRGQCRWPYGDPGRLGFHLCGRRVVRGAYCAPHGAIAYRPGTQTKAGLDGLSWLD